MTCVIILQDKNGALLASDCAAIAADRSEVYTMPHVSKIFQVGPWGVGFTQSFRAGQALRYGVRWPDPPEELEDLERFLVTEVVPEVRRAYQEAGCLQVKDGTEQGSLFALTMGRKIFTTYNKGLLRSVPGFASSISYQGSGMLHQIAHANGITVTTARDASGIDRPASISTTAGWSTGNHTYDGVGNISNIGSVAFLYDGRTGVLTAEVPAAAGSTAVAAGGASALAVGSAVKKSKQRAKHALDTIELLEDAHEDLGDPDVEEKAGEISEKE
jgi:hypothetical protein